MDQFSDMSMLDKLATLGKGGLLQLKHWSEASKHGSAPERQLRQLRAAEYGLPTRRVNRNPMDRAVNYAGGYDWGVNPTVPLEDALDMAKAYQLFDYMTTFDKAREADAQKDYEENVAGVLAAQPYRSSPRPEREMLREAAEYGKRGYADGGRVNPLKLIAEELPKFWESEQAAGARGMVKGLGDLLGIRSASEPVSVMSDTPSEENAVRSLTPWAVAAVPAARLASGALKFAGRNPLTTGAALTYATEDPTNLIMNPIALAATYSPEAEAVVKPKGGNWLSSVERALTNLKSPYQPAELDAWVKGPLTKYIKTYMGTEEDPVRKLAEQGMLHVNPEELNLRPNWINSTLATHLKGISPEARTWEGASDLAINPMKVKGLSSLTVVSDPWTAKLGPEELIYGMSDPQNTARDLGFSHIRDELRNAIEPDSGLPATLRLKPEDLKQMGMEKAVRHVAAINAWREAQQAEANLAKSMNPATHTVKEYPEGYKLVELKAPSNLPEGVKLEPKAGGYDIVGPNGEDLGWAKTEREAIQQSNSSKALEEALKYEGDTMGHCVGGYCEGVSRGDSRIFSIRDAKGRPHVTIETRPPQEEGGLPSIIQIKGKGNKAPAEKYQSMVQDFVKSQDWGKVGDLGNAGLVIGPEGKPITRQEMLQQYESLPESIKDTPFIQQRIGWLKNNEETNYDYQEALDYVVENANRRRYAQGGSVQPAHFDDLTAFLSR